MINLQKWSNNSRVFNKGWEFVMRDNFLRCRMCHGKQLQTVAVQYYRASLDVIVNQVIAPYVISSHVIASHVIVPHVIAPMLLFSS